METASSIDAFVVAASVVVCALIYICKETKGQTCRALEYAFFPLNILILNTEEQGFQLLRTTATMVED